MKQGGKGRRTRTRTRAEVKVAGSVLAAAMTEWDTGARNVPYVAPVEEQVR